MLLCSASTVYLLSTCLLASRKLMWHDEFFTYHISRLPTTSDIWSALSTGGEQIPPLFYIITRASRSLFGVSELAIRLPEVLGFWVMSLCLFQFVSKRSSALYGFAAMLFPLVTKAYSYAYEARPYGIVLGFAGVSLVCWQSAVEEHYRKLSLVGLAVSLAAAVSCHYYAILLLFPLAVGEAVRSCFRRRLDLPIWVALGMSTTPLLLFLPLIQRARIHSATFWSQAHWSRILDSYFFLLTPALLALVAMLVLSSLYSTTLPGSVSNQKQVSRSTPPFHEIAAALGFIALPVVGFMLAKFVTGAITGRYVLPSVIGFSIVFAFAAYRLLDGRAVIGATLVLSLCIGFMMLVVTNFLALTEAHLRQARNYEFLRSNSESTLPIVASDLGTFMEFAHYGPPDIASRVVYLADPQASLRYLGHNSVDRAILDLRPWFRLKIEDYAPYVASQKRFLVYVRGGYLNDRIVDFKWLLSELNKTNWRIELRSRGEDGILFLVSSGR